MAADARLVGPVVRLRPMSKYLLFLDVRTEGAGDVTAMLKASTGRNGQPMENGHFTKEELEHAAHAVKLGDVVDVVGVDAGKGIVAAVMAPVVRVPWAVAGNGRTFVPGPPPDRNGNGNGNGDGGDAQAERHAAAAAPCKFFVHTGRCPKGDACAFSHDATREERNELQVAFVAAQSAARRRRAAGDGTDAERVLPKRDRAKVFAAFLAETFAVEALNAGRGVLDVAGGRGTVAFALQAEHGVRATVVDPRGAVALTKDQRRRHGEEADALLPASIASMFERGSEADVLAADCSCLVGMHPDEATEAIVDRAVALRKSFAVVPCCVFARAFPHRAHVITREAFCEYLMTKAPGARCARLPFAGANDVVYWHACRPD